MMSDVLDQLIDGEDCCLCDTPGPHRTAALTAIVRSALDCGFLVVQKDALQIPLRSQDWSAYRDCLRLELSSKNVAKVLTFDNCDRAFSGAIRVPAEQILSLVGSGGALDAHGLTRLVFALGPRDISAVGLSPDVRERCKIFSSQEVVSPDRLSMTPIDDIWFAQIWGSLRQSEKFRCRDVVISAVQSVPRRWRSLDRFLFPLIYSSQGVVLPNPHLVGWQTQFLCAQLWPDMDLNLSAQRFGALIGFEQQALWVDPYLSFDGNLDASKLKVFLQNLFRISPTLQQFEMLARVKDAAALTVFRSRAAAVFQNEQWANRVIWKVFDKAGGNVHDRHLILRNREEAFSLPPADRILAMNRVGNEADSALGYSASAQERAIWNSAPQVFP